MRNGLICFAALLTSLAFQAARKPAQAQSPPVPVVVQTAGRQDVPIFTQGVGTVQAYRSVQIRARVDGALTRIDFTEGAELQPGDRIAQIDPRPYQAILAQAQARRGADQAQLDNAKLDLARYAALARSSFASRQQLDSQAAAVRQATANLAGDDATIAAAALNLSFCDIVSPIHGVAGLRQVDIGNLVHAADTQPIVTITQVHPIAVVFTLPQNQLARVRQAMTQGPARVIAAGSDDGAALSEGTLLTPSNTIDPQSGTIALKAVFDNADNHLWPGQFVAARLQLAVRHGAITIPPRAIQHGPDGLFVYVVGSDDTVARQAVELGYETPDMAVVSKGLNGGEAVVVEGQGRLDSGVKVSKKTGGEAPPQTPSSF